MMVFKQGCFWTYNVHAEISASINTDVTVFLLCIFHTPDVILQTLQQQESVHFYKIYTQNLVLTLTQQELYQGQVRFNDSGP